ncbi:MAG: hypothetical protein E5Y29_28095, partial [Mesorhizobium sp.]
VMIGATEEAAAVVVLFLIGELLEGVAAGRARASIQGLADLVPKTALVERAGGTSEIPAEDLVVGDVILVRPRTYTPAVLAVGALVAMLPPLLIGGDWNEWIYKGLGILLIGCPCALVISTPAAIAAGLAAGARRGLLMKGGAVLEGFRRVTAVAFDKT